MTSITGQPHYQQVATDLRRKILDGTHPPGEPLPSTKRLMEIYGVSLTVVRGAINELRVEGVVRGQPGKAVYVIREPDTSGGSGAATVASQLAELAATVRQLDERLSVLEAERGVERS